MTDMNLSKALGKGDYKVATGIKSITSGDTITADFSNIISVSLTAEAASGDYNVANVESISGGVVTVLLAGAASGTAPSTLSADVNVHYVIIGY
jgi:hypothetical protein